MKFKSYLHFIKVPVFLSMLTSLVFLLGSCEGPPKQLSIADKTEVDSMYRKTMKTLRPEMDSLCVVKKDSLIAYMVDSLLDANIREINRQLERIKNLQEK
ncbi:MAG: hypothetical protein R2879_01315 [Saprospiraceae bacterium]